MSDNGEHDSMTEDEAGAGLDPKMSVCGNCMFWRGTHEDDRGRRVGPCRVVPDRGDIPETSAPCDRFRAKGSPIPTAPPIERSRRRSRVLGRTDPLVRRSAGGGVQPVEELSSPAPQLLDPNKEVLDMTQHELLDLLQEFFGGGPVPRLARRYAGGRVLIEPGQEGLSSKEVPIEVFFKKLIRVRDQIRVLEQKINGHESLSSSEKLELQAYITRCYGALTTFNVLFADSDDRFVGERSSS